MQHGDRVLSPRIVIGALALATVVVLVAFLIGVFPYWRDPPTFTYPVPRGFLLTEDSAIHYTKQSLREWGLNGDELQVLPYKALNANESGESDFNFSMNTLDGRKGSVMWMSHTGRYAVNIEHVGGMVECRIYLQK